MKTYHVYIEETVTRTRLVEIKLPDRQGNDNHRAQNLVKEQLGGKLDAALGDRMKEIEAVSKPKIEISFSGWRE